MKPKKVTSGGKVILFGTSLGVSIAVILSLILAAVFTSLVINETISYATMNYFSFIILALSVFVGAMTACLFVKNKYAIIAGIVSAGCFLLMFAVKVLCIEGVIEGFWPTIGVITVGGVAACAVCISAGRKKVKRKYRTR